MDNVDCSTPGSPGLHYLPEFAQAHVHWACDAIYPPHPLSPPSPPALNLSQHQGLFQCVGISHQLAKVLELSFSISPSSEYAGLISFRIDWFDILAVQGTLKSPLQHHNSKASILWHLAFFMVQLSHPYMTTGKTTGLMLWNFVGKIMSLLFRWKIRKQQQTKSCCFRAPLEMTSPSTVTAVTAITVDSLSTYYISRHYARDLHIL